MENTANRELKMTRMVKAPIDLVWKAWTEPEYIAQWWPLIEGISGKTIAL